MNVVLRIIAATFSLMCVIGCTSKKAELGSDRNPVKLAFLSSPDAQVIEDNSKFFKSFLEKTTPYKFAISIPTSYAAVVEALGAEQADIAACNTYGYIMAFEKYQAEARLTVLRHGSSVYQSQFIVREESPIKKLSDIKGQKMAFVDASSASGYLLPLKVLKEKNALPGSIVFAGKHDNVVTMVYNGQVDAGATFFEPADAEGIQDARRLVKTRFPDVEKKVRILDLTESVPNDPIVFRKSMPEEMKNVITEAFLKFVETPDGKEALKKIYGVDGIKRASDADYDRVREMLKTLGQTATDLMKK